VGIYNAVETYFLAHHQFFWAHFWTWYYHYVQTHGGKGQPAYHLSCHVRHLVTELQRRIIRAGF
jgi:hypothetical protein